MQRAHDKSATLTQRFHFRKFSFLMVYVVFFGVLNETVFNVSTPKIAEQFQLLPSEVSWVLTTFIIAFGLGQIVFGKLADIYDLRRLIAIGIVMYASASFIGFLFQAFYPLVIFGRAVQGAGASALPALTMVIVARYFTQEQRGKLFGLFTSTASFAVGVGPVVGGFVSAYLHWSFLFLIPLFTLASLPMFMNIFPK
jgi:DHA2 family metal-tetracycline-proton antiporter-like MFS transporter